MDKSMWLSSCRLLQVSGVTLPAGGDVVVGQEYTDFDKGLDDGVEGEVFGFYLFRTATPSARSEARHEDEHQLLAERRGDERQHLPDDAPRINPYRPLRLAPGPPLAWPGPGAEARRRGHNKRYSLYSPPKDFLRRVPLRVQRLYALCTDHLVPEDRADAVVSWPSSPVRVFGGAIISNVNAGCGDF